MFYIMCIKRRQIHKKQLSFVCTEIPWCQNLLLLTSSKGTLDWMYNFQVSSSLLLSQRNQVKKHQQHNTANVPVLLPIREFFSFSLLQSSSTTKNSFGNAAALSGMWLQKHTVVWRKWYRTDSKEIKAEYVVCVFFFKIKQIRNNLPWFYCQTFLPP